MYGPNVFLKEPLSNLLLCILCSKKRFLFKFVVLEKQILLLLLFTHVFLGFKKKKKMLCTI